MELDKFLHKVQGVLKNEQRILGSLSLLKRENEEDCLKVVESIKKIFGDEQVNSNVKDKLYVLLFMNTDSDIYSALKRERKYAHLVGVFPKLSRDLFMKIVIGLQLHECLYKSIVHFCSSLSYQVLDMCLGVVTWLDLFEAVSFVQNILISLFYKLVSIEEEDKYNTPLKDIFQRLLLHYDAEKGGNISRMKLWKKFKLKHYAGLVMASLLTVLEKCTKSYCKINEKFSDESNELYKIHIDQEAFSAPILKSETNNRDFSMQQCYEHVVAKCYENICSITVDLWLFWVEVDLDDIPDTENTLQRLVGEKAYSCREILKEAECSGVSSKEASDLISKLKNFSLKPHNEEDQSASLDLPEILVKIQDPIKDKTRWLKYLVSNSLFAVEPSALEVIKSHLSAVQTSDLLKLFQLLFTFIKTNKANTCQKNFVLSTIRFLDSESQKEISKCFVGVLSLSDVLKTEDFQPVFVDTFNKVINEEDKEKELHPQFLWLALQSAQEVVDRAVAEAITSEVRGHMMAVVLNHLQAFCDAPDSRGKPLLIAALSRVLLRLPDLPDQQQSNYPLFVRELVMGKILDGERFIKECLMTELHHQLKTKNWIVLTACLETLSELYDINCVLNCPTSVVMVLQVLQAARWSPTTFSLTKVRVCDLALQQVQQLVVKWINIGVEDKHLNNMTELVSQCISPLNRYHLYRLLIKEPIPADPALLLVYRMHFGIGEWSVLQVTPEERSRLVYSLCYVLPMLTSLEWQELFCVVAPKCTEFLWLFQATTDALLLCVDSAKVAAQPNVMACLEFAVLNAAQVIKYEVNQWTKDDNEYRISTLNKICQLLSSFPLAQQESFGPTLVKVLQQLLPEGSRRKPLTDAEMNSVTASIAAIQAATVRQSLAKEFLDMVHR